MVNADEARRELARRELARRRGQTAQQGDERNSLLGRIDAGVRGAADMLTLGFADEISAGLGTGFGYLGDYDAELARQRGIDQSDYENRFGYRLAGQLGGGIAGGTALAGAGLSAAANAARAGGGLGRVALGSAVDGAVLGGAHGFGSGEGLEGRVQGAAVGSAVGTLTGGAAPYAIAGAQAAFSPFTAWALSRRWPEHYANKALGEGLRRAGMTADDVAAALQRSQADDQGMYMAADAMGHSGQRLLSTVARNPNDMRQQVVDALMERQLGQGERLSSFLAEALNAPDTAAQRAASLAAQRAQLANVNYEAARAGAGAVDVSGAIALADDILQPGVTRLANPGSNIADDTLEGVVRRARALLTDGRSMISDFNSVLRAKQDIADMIGAAQRQGRNNQVRLLSQLNERLDAALEAASPLYRAANDAFRAQSRTIEAVEAGKAATSGRLRAADTIPQFRTMGRGEQMAFRAGYADPLIARIEAASSSPTTNKARLLLTGKTKKELPAFAIPQRAPKLGRRIAREQRMFETANAALGGSRTADNLADAAEMAGVDPEVLSGLLTGSVRSVLSSIGRRIAAETGGMSPRVIERVAEALIETRPDAARHLLTVGAKTAAQNEVRNAVLALLIGSGAGATAGRLLAAP